MDGFRGVIIRLLWRRSSGGKNEANFKPSYDTRVRGDMQYLITCCPYFSCDKCGYRFRIRSCLKYSIFRKKGSTLVFPCPVCGFKNKRVKGSLKKMLDNRWGVDNGKNNEL